MLDRTYFASWQQRIGLYCRGKDNGVNILKSIDEGSYKLGTFRETLAESTEGTPQFGPERPRVYSDLYSVERDRFSKLINDMRNTKMTMPKLQLNSKFVNNMLPEWGRFVTAVKLKRGLRESNYDQLFAYLKQHEAHSKENKMVLERLAQPLAQPTADPLALLSNVSNAQHGLPSSSTSSITPLTLPHANSTDDLIENLTSTVVVQNVQGRPNRGQGMNPWGGNAAGYGEAHNRVGNVNQGQARPGQARTAQENGVALDAEQLLFLAGGPDNAFDDDVDEYPVQDLALNMDNVFQAEDCDAFDSDVDEAPTAQTMFMANFSSADPITDEAGPSYDSDILSEYVKENDVSVVHSNASSVPNDTFMMIYDDMCEPIAYLSPTQETTILKQNFKQKENKLLADFLNMKLLKEKVKDRLVKQDQSLQTVHMLCRPMPLYNDLNKAKVHNSEDTLEIAELTRKKMNAKMTDPECVTHKVKIAPHDYSKENLLATFTPQKQLTPEQIYWSNDLIKLKFEALKERAKVSKTIKAFTVYPPNTPTTLVPRVIPTTSQVKIYIFTLIQQFLEFDKTCKKRITPSAITDGERDFEQTNACYLQEVIPFFQTIKDNFEAITDGEWCFEQTKACYLQEVIPFFQIIKDNFEGIQKALTREVKQMKDVFKELEAEVDQCAVYRKHDAIDRKNLLIANDNLIAQCLSKEVFSAATKSELNVARFTEMHVTNTFVEARCLDLEAELATLRDKSHQENQGELIKHFSKLEGKDNAIRQLKKQLSKLQATCRDTKCTVKVQTTDSQLTKVTDPVTNLQAQNDRFRAENDKVKQHYKQLYDSIKIILTKLIAENVTLKTSVSKAKVQPSVLTQTKHAVEVELIVPRLRNNRDAHLDYLRHLKESVETIRDIVEEAKVVRPLDRSIVSACRYTQHSQELLEYAIGTCPQGSQQQAKQLAHTPLIRKKQVPFTKPFDSIFHQKTVPRTPQQNGVIERRKRTLVKAARTILIFSKSLMFLWAEAVATVSVSSAGTPLSTTIDQDAPSLHISSSSSALQSHSLPPDVVAEPPFMEDHNVAPIDNNPFVNGFAPEPHSEASSLGDISSTESPYVSQTLHHLNK
nr:putative ribonuclease H-like domain-containing protein [Tanacetum cinerariifolium]